MVATRRSVSRKSEVTAPQSNKRVRNKTLENTAVTDAVIDNESDVPLSKRRRQISPEDTDGSITTETGATTTSTDTPITCPSLADGEDEEPKNKRLFFDAVIIPDSEGESEFSELSELDSDDDFKPETPSSRRRASNRRSTFSLNAKGKQRATSPDQYEDSDSESSSVARSGPKSVRKRANPSGSSSRKSASGSGMVPDFDSDAEIPNIDFSDDEDFREDTVEANSGGEDVADETEEERPRRRFTHIAVAPNKKHKALYKQHPSLEGVWDELENTPPIVPKEDPQPPGLSLSLLPFQREGLHWLRVQEKGPYKGGILADEMGMGKTIQTIALLMTEPEAKPNLVIAPVVALMQWKSEIEKYTNGALSVYMYHGPKRTNDPKVLAKYNVIMSSYSTVEAAWRKQEKGLGRVGGLVKQDSALHALKYHRLILDEAHSIKDRFCNTSKAIYALESKYKLCLSGTPLQNRIGEIFSLIRFLDIYPFAYHFCRVCDCKSVNNHCVGFSGCVRCGHSSSSHTHFFNHFFLKPIQDHGNESEGAVAFGRLHSLLKHIMLRRTKREREDDLGLPPKVVRIRRDKFSEEEIDLYDSIYSDGKRKFDTYVSQGVVLNNYANLFTLITRMRQMADHPDLVLRRQGEDADNNLVCCICDDEAEDAIKANKCKHMFCRDCVTRYVNGYTPDYCNDGDAVPGDEDDDDEEEEPRKKAGKSHRWADKNKKKAESEVRPPCPKCFISLDIDLNQAAIEPEDLPSGKKGSIISRINMSKWRSSTKIEALCEELHKLRTPHESTKSIVFSQFTSMLQLIEWRLNRGGFKTVMLEGSMTPDQRNAVIKHFMENADVEVFLVSLKAGGIALNLIEANQVFLMEPWWNPSVEWQAADRIHRIGQKRVCRVTRMVIEDSIESRIVELQEKKTRMIEATVNADHKALDRLTPADMQFLFQN